MKNKCMRYLAAILCMAMLMSALPMNVWGQYAFAETGDEYVMQVSEIETASTDPTDTPTENPTDNLTDTPTENPTDNPTDTPTENPTDAPTENPTDNPTDTPTENPTDDPTDDPTENPTDDPTDTPTENPTEDPTDAPTEIPTEAPTEVPAEILLAEQAEAQLRQLVDEWIAELNAKHYSEDFDKVLWLHDRLLDHVSADDSLDAAQTAVAAIVDGKAGSVGYALAFEMLLNAADIENCIAFDGNNSKLAWNAVKMDGEWTHIDVFANDEAADEHTYFGMTDAAIARDHAYMHDVPACTGTSNNYFVHEAGYIACMDDTDFVSLFATAGTYKLYAATGNDIAAAVAAIPAEHGIVATVDQDGCYAVADVAFVVAKIIPAQESVTIGVSQKISLADWNAYPEAASASVSYASSSTKIATVSADGVVTGKKAGTAYITIQAESGASCEVKVVVCKAPSSIKLKASRSTLGVGETVKLSYTLSSKSAASVTFTSSDEAVATVDANGVVTAVGVGKCKITAKTHNGRKSSVTITVKKQPETLILSDQTLKLGVGQQYTLNCELDKGAVGTVAFGTTNAGIAEIDAQSGAIKALAIGECTIYAETYNGVHAECRLEVVSAPESIAIVADRTTIGRKETLQLRVETTPENSACSVSWKSSKTSVATVSKDGLVTAKKTGTVTITATTHNDKTATIKITIKKYPSSVKLDAERYTLGVGETVQLSATLSSGSAGSYSFSSADPAIASVDADGKLTAHAAGTVKITVKTFNGKKNTKTFTICEAPTSVTFSQSQLTIGSEDSFALKAAVNAGSAGSIRYTSSDSSVAAISEGNKLIAGAVGECTIAAETYNGKTAILSVKVIPAPESIAIVADRTTIGRKETLQLRVETTPEGSACSASWKSGKTSVATVSKDGLVTAKKAGTATITATSYNGKTATIKITVKKAPSSVKISADSKNLGVGETVQLSATLSSGSAGSYSFASSKPEIASVDANGKLTAHAVGSTKITVTTFNGKKSSATFEVLPAPTNIAIDGGNLVMGVDDSKALQAHVNAGAGGSIRYSIADATIAEINPVSGKISARAVGTTAITATTYNNLAATVMLEVKPAPTYIEFGSGTLYIGVGDSIQLNPEMDAGSAATLQYSTSKSKYATVNADGVVKGVRTGTAVITVKTHNGLKDTIKVVVKKAPSSVKLAEKAITLGVGETHALNASWTAGTYTSLSYASDSDAIATIDADGKVTAHNVGSTTLCVSTHNGKTAKCTLTVMQAPGYVQLTAPQEMGVGDSANLLAELSPNSASALKYSVSAGTAVKIDANGLVTAVEPGTATVRVQTYLADVWAEAEILVRPAPKQIVFDAESYIVNIDETLQLNPQVLPAGAYGDVRYEVETEGYFTIDANGLITPVRHGIARVKAYMYNGVYAYISIRVIDPNFPESIEIDETPTYLNEGDSFELSYTVFPDTAARDMVWTSSNKSIATISGDTIRAKSYGRATISGVSQLNPELTVKFTLIVLSEDRCLVMPERRTGTSGISANLRKIASVEDSAYRELDALYAQGVITQADYNKRKSIIANAFEMYAFPWMTTSYQAYWKAANSEDGAKDFKPGIVYYGLPYITSPWNNRLYNVDKALAQNRYTDSGKGYYLLNRSKLLDGMYCGNDCSAFVSMAIFGTSGPYYNDTTNGIATSAAFKTMLDYTDLRPGDLLNREGRHVVMFLYYANADRTQMVIIEQGGTEPAINTVSCSIKSVSSYQEENYIIRRLKTLG